MTHDADTIEPRLLEILRCPGCRSTLTLGHDTLTCDGCGKRFEIRDSIPVLLLDEAL